MNWFVYIVRCRNDDLYTGITTDIKRRVNEHNSNNAKGARSLRGRRPVYLVYAESYETQSQARTREAEIKRWKRENKIKLINKGKLKGFIL